MRKLVPPFGIKDRLNTPRAKPSLERTFFWKAKIVKVKEVTKGKKANPEEADLCEKS